MNKYLINVTLLIIEKLFDVNIAFKTNSSKNWKLGYFFAQKCFKESFENGKNRPAICPFSVTFRQRQHLIKTILE